MKHSFKILWWSETCWNHFLQAGCKRFEAALRLSLSHICELFSEWSSETLPYRLPAPSLLEGYECFAPQTTSSSCVDGKSLQCTETPRSTAPSPRQEKKPKPHHSQRKPAGRAKRIHHKTLQEVISGSIFGFATVDAGCFEKKKTSLTKVEVIKTDSAATAGTFRTFARWCTVNRNDLHLQSSCG